MRRGPFGADPRRKRCRFEASGATILWYRPRFAGLTRTHPGSFQQLGEPSVGERPSSDLAPRAVERLPVRVRDPSDRAPAPRARGPRPVVHGVVLDRLPLGQLPGRRPAEECRLPREHRADRLEEAPPVLVARLRRELERRQARLVEDLVGEPVSDAIARWSVRRVLSWREAARSDARNAGSASSPRRVRSDRPQLGERVGIVGEPEARASRCRARSGAARSRRRRRCGRPRPAARFDARPIRGGSEPQAPETHQVQDDRAARFALENDVLPAADRKAQGTPRRTTPEERPSGAAQAGAPRSLRFAAPRPRRQVLGQDLEERSSGTATRGARPRSACSGTDARATSSRARRTAPAPATP